MTHPIQHQGATMMITDETVERAARAIAATVMWEFDGWRLDEDVPWERVCPKDQDKLREVARLALAASPHNDGWEAMRGVREILAKVADRQADDRESYLHRGQPDSSLLFAIREIDKALPTPNATDLCPVSIEIPEEEAGK